MTSSELKNRIEKAEEKIAKKAATIAKKEKWIAEGKGGYWYADDIERLNGEIAETRLTIERYQKQLRGEIERERAYAKEVPASMKELENELAERWNEFDFKQRESVRAAYEADSRAALRDFGRSGYELRHKTDAEIIEANKRDAKYLVIDLYNRIKAITGEVTDWTRMFASGGALNGIVVGKEGRAKIETILAGGYNIQRLHIRVLVHSV